MSGIAIDAEYTITTPSASSSSTVHANDASNTSIVRLAPGAPAAPNSADGRSVAVCATRLRMQALPDVV
ncbi:MAG: hypothetical protein ABW005_10645, partial [Burkholderiaceae bacterium]